MLIQKEITPIEAQGDKRMITWRCPSNIALVKYWGKKDFQVPCNPSLSFTLQQAATTTSIQYAPREDFSKHVSFDFYFEGKERPDFSMRIEKFLASRREHFRSLDQYHLSIHSHNSFPHSAGIASSASAFGALALGLCSLEQTLKGVQKPSGDEFWKLASETARLGSGSACRSIYGQVVLWGHAAEYYSSTDQYAIPISQDIHPIFQTFQDSILIVQRGTKKVSSTLGHQMMEGHPFATIRYEQAHKNISRMISAMKTGDVFTAGEVIEEEALQLHAMMMCSQPGFVLMHPNTLHMIRIVQDFRHHKAVPVYFTLDAGPNVHLLYPKEHREVVQELIKTELLPFCFEGNWIDDEVGWGPEKIN